jgi:hypothetical protein
MAANSFGITMLSQVAVANGSGIESIAFTTVELPN